MNIVLIYLFMGASIVAALGILFSKNVLYSAFLLMVCLLGIAGFYAMAHAQFIAVVQILVYVGGVLVLMIFGIMLTKAHEGKPLLSPQHQSWSGGILALLLFAFLAQLIVKNPFPESELLEKSNLPAMQLMGFQLLTDYVLAFELVAVLLLITLLGSAYIAQKQE